MRNPAGVAGPPCQNPRTMNPDAYRAESADPDGAVPRHASGTAVRCTACGVAAQPGNRFCGSCGAPLPRALVPAAPEVRQASVVALVGPRVPSDRLVEVARQLEGEATELGDGRAACVFGAPRSLEDHLRRAILAALRIRDGSHEGLGTLGIAVASGRLAADPARWHDTLDDGNPLVGAMALAAGAQPGEIVIDPSLLPQVPDGIEVEPAADGGDAPARIVGPGSAPSDLKRRPRSLSRFVGRERQMRLIDEALSLATAGVGQAVGIVGEPGMGKSRLVEEARRAAGGVRWIEGRCSPYGRSHPYLPVLDLVAQLCGVPMSRRAEAPVAETFRRFAAPAAGAPYVLNLLGGLDQAAEEELIAPFSPEAVRVRTFEALRHLLLAASQDEPLVISVEDLHWADDTSERFLASLASALAASRVLLLTTYRPGHRPGWLDLSHATQIALTPLGPADSLEVVRSVLGPDEVPETFGRAILARGEGNPFFLEELSLASPGGVGEGVVPGQVEDVLMARIDRLGDPSRSILQTASILGRRFTSRLLSAVWPGTVTPGAGTEELVREEFLVEAVVEGEGGYEFKHALTQDVAYHSVSPEVRRASHRAVGLRLEELYAGRTDEVGGLLAHHWARTDDAPRAVAYLQRAAERSSARYAHAEASAMLRDALRHAQRLPVGERERRSVELSLRLVASLYFLGRMDESEELLSALAPTVAEVPDPVLATSYHFWAAHTASHLGKPGDAEHGARRAIALAEGLGDDAALGRALYIRTRQGWWTGRFEEGVREGARAIPLLERAGETWWLGHCHFFVAHSLYQMGRFEQAVEAAARGGAIGDAVADPRLRSWAAWARGLYEAARGATGLGIAECERGIELSPDEPNTAWALGALGFARREHGDIDAALRDLERSIRIAERTGHPGILSRFLGWLGETRLRAGDVDAAREAAERSGALGAAIGCRWVVALSLRTRGRIAFAAGDLPAARRLLGEARASLDDLGCEFDLALCHADLARLAHAQGRDPGPAMAAALALLETVPAPIVRERLVRLAGEMGLSEHDPAGVLRLTSREFEVLALIAEGLTNRQIAERLVISEGTAIRHVSNIFGKLGVSNRSAATRAAIENGLAGTPAAADASPGGPEM